VTPADVVNRYPGDAVLVVARDGDGFKLYASDPAIPGEIYVFDCPTARVARVMIETSQREAKIRGHVFRLFGDDVPASDPPRAALLEVGGGKSKIKVSN
jgi:hypothetical protein